MPVFESPAGVGDAQAAAPYSTISPYWTKSCLPSTGRCGPSHEVAESAHSSHRNALSVHVLSVSVRPHCPVASCIYLVPYPFYLFSRPDTWYLPCLAYLVFPRLRIRILRIPAHPRTSTHSPASSCSVSSTSLPYSLFPSLILEELLSELSPWVDYYSRTQQDRYAITIADFYDFSHTDDDKDYLQAVYEDECKILRTISAQTDQVAKILDRRIAQSLSQSTGCFPLCRRFLSGVQTTEPFSLEDSDVTSDESDEMRGGNLGTGMHEREVFRFLPPLPSVTPTIPSADEAAYSQDDSFGLGQASQSHPDPLSGRIPANFGEVSADEDGFNLDRNAFGAYASTSGPSTSHAGASVPALIPRDRRENAALTTHLSAISYTGTQFTAQQSSIATIDPQMLQLRANPPTAPATSAHAEQVTHTTSADSVAPAISVTPAVSVAPIDPFSPVVSIAPIMISIEPAPQQPVAPVTIRVSSDVQKQITVRAKTKLVQYWLTLHAMAGSDAQKRAVVNLAIADAIPGIIGMHVHVSNPTMANQRQQLMGAWTTMFTNLVKLVWVCAPFSFDIYPPQGSNVVPDELRRRVIDAVINDQRHPLAFMHQFTVNSAGDVTILDGVLNNSFILRMVICFVWCSNTGILDCITDPLKDFNSIFAAIGAVTKLILFEQMLHPPVTIAHSQLDTSNMFLAILQYIQGLHGVQKEINITMTGILAAKQKAMDNAVWRIGISQKRQHPSVPEEPKKHRNPPAQKKPCTDTTTGGITRPAIPQASTRKCREFNIDEGSTSITKHRPPPKKETKWKPTSRHASKDVPCSIDNAFLGDEPEEISDFQPGCDEEEADDSDEAKSIVKFLSAEVPNFVSEAEKLDFPLTKPTWPPSQAATSKLTSAPVATKVRQTAEPFPFSSAQPRAPVASRQAKSQSTHDQTRAKTQFNAHGHIKTPTWVDDSNDGVITSENSEGLEAMPDDHSEHKSPKDDFIIVDDDDDSGHREEPQLVRSANAGKLKLMDQTSDTHQLTEKNRFTRDTLSTAARTCGVLPIHHRLKTDDSYASVLSTLVEAQVPLFHTELKDDAYAHVTAYYHLGPDCIDTSKALLASHVYHFAQHFDEKNVPIPQGAKPYSADILPYLMKGRYFNGPKLVGAKFTDRFKEIAGNKAQRPEIRASYEVDRMLGNGEVIRKLQTLWDDLLNYGDEPFELSFPPIRGVTPSLMLMANVYAALLWKASKSPSKFNFTGNQFSEVYFFHMKFLNGMKETAPGKFHRLMADIFEAVQKLCTNGAATLSSHNDAMAFLDLDGMDDDE
ncbi:hypothetical protein DEU56DRAFT_907301 [Suillus clintonianus]|uniref:uncharacterized protein n=1 Tax=Suillus clintonianus TaxID=1904413 RepID=UPI001B8694E4|nr:uncharacterized protein DEU56DRAFT_907301 [Suillus clintonianus]KAG2153821.1 hypothetical protein DEU56DRAFT_907301 [Suillus clintonianus]